MSKGLSWLVGMVGAGALSAAACGDSDAPVPGPRAGSSGTAGDSAGQGGESASAGGGGVDPEGGEDSGGRGGKGGKGGTGGRGGTSGRGGGSGAGHSSSGDAGAGGDAGPNECDALDCDDGNPCTADSCREGEGCRHDGSGVTDACDDGNECTSSDVCQGDAAGSCAGEITSTACDDGNSCTEDVCNVDGGCDHVAVQRNDCRPAINVTYPARGATIQGSASEPSVEVRGTVNAGGDLGAFFINGTPVAVAADGSFSYVTPVGVGANTLSFLAENALGATQTRVQTFLWSTGYLYPDQPKNGIDANAARAWFDESVVDDGDPAMPADDIATIVEMGVEREFPIDHVAVGSFDELTIYADKLSIADADISLEVVDGGVIAVAALRTIRSDLTITGPAGSLPAALTYDTGDATVHFAVNVDQTHLIALTATEVEVSLGEADFSSPDPDLNDLGDAVLLLLGPTIEAQMVAEFENIVAGELATQLEDSLNLYVQTVHRTLEKPDGSNATVSFDVVLDYATALFEADRGVTLGMRSGAYGTLALPAGNLGVPLRASCLRNEQAPDLARESPIEFLVAHDTLNQHLYSAWRQGFWGFAVPAGELEIGDRNLDFVNFAVSGQLALTAMDCAEDGVWRGTLGDLRLSFSGRYEEVELTAEGYATIVMTLEPRVSSGRLSVYAKDLVTLDSDLRVNQDDGIRYEADIKQMLEAYLTSKLFFRLKQSALAWIGLPYVSGIGFTEPSVERLPGHLLASGVPGPLVR
ncbi:MAG TPA: hypothetical protein VGK73_40360 [Polyangiaceae bacterium]